MEIPTGPKMKKGNSGVLISFSFIKCLDCFMKVENEEEIVPIDIF